MITRRALRTRAAIQLQSGQDPLLVQQAYSALADILEADTAASEVVLPPQALRLPRPVAELMADMLHLLSGGSAVQLVPVDAELTTGEAATMLGVSRPTLVKMLEEGVFPFHKAGGRRRVLFVHVVAYLDKRDLQAAERARGDGTTE